MYEQFIAVTNRKLCKNRFLDQIAKLAQTDVQAILLREKDLKEAEYAKLAEEVLAVCKEYDKPCILHTYAEAAKIIKHKSIHLPFEQFCDRKPVSNEWNHLGTSVHTVAEAVKAEQLGASYLIAGHIFETACKAGLPGRGVDFLKQICQAVSIPVYGIGGIMPSQLPLLKQAGAAGGCMMSYFMYL